MKNGIRVTPENLPTIYGRIKKFALAKRWLKRRILFTNNLKKAIRIFNGSANDPYRYSNLMSQSHEQLIEGIVIEDICTKGIPYIKLFNYNRLCLIISLEDEVRLVSDKLYVYKKKGNCIEIWN